MILDIIHPHWLKGARTHMQGDSGPCNSVRIYLRQQLLGKMQPRSRRRYSTLALGKYRLVTLLVGDFVRAIEWIRDGLVDPAPIITHRFPLSEAAAAFRTAADKQSGAVKVVVEGEGR